MADIKIIIDNQVVDLPVNDLNLNLTYSLKDRDGFAVNTGSRSEYSFELPSTHNNDVIFSRFYDVSEETGNKQVLLTASIEVNGLPFFSGLAQLTSTTIEPDLYYWKGKTYKVGFYGNNVDWVAQLKDKYIYQYDFGTHTFDSGTVLSSFSNVYTDIYKYILIKWKNWSVSGEVQWSEFTPALFVKAILDRIFSDISYTYTSNFFSLDSAERLIMPVPLADKIDDPQYGKDYLNVTLSEPPTNLEYFIPTPPYLVTPFLFTNIVQPNLATPYNIGTGFYTVPVTGYYYARLTVDVVSTGFHRSWFNVAINNDVTNPIPNSTILFGGLFAPYSGNAYASIESDVVYLTAGTQLSLGIANAEVPTGQNVTTWEFKLEIFGEAEVSSGLQVDFRYFLNKEWNSLEFIKGLAHAFNLTFQTDVDNRNVTIEPADTYLNQSRPAVQNNEQGFYETTILDLTEDVDLIKGGEIYSRSDINQLVKFSWQYDSNDPTLEALNGIEAVALHQARFTFIPNRFQKDEDLIENPFFSSTLVIADSTIQGANTTKTPMMPIIWSENYLENTSVTEANYDIMPRLLATDKTDPEYNGTININDGATTNEYDTPVAYMVDYNNTTGDFMSLSFGSETVNGFQIQGLLERFYIAEFIRRQAGKEVECYIFWDALMIRQLDFRKRVKIHGDNYILQEINSFSVTSNESTKTYLIYDDLGNGTEQTQIRNTLLIGKLNV
jgi:hypothetical protein